MGEEDTVDEYIDRLMKTLNEVKRVLKSHGTAWIVIGDSYERRRGKKHRRKALRLIPERAAIALESDDWIVRSRIVWEKHPGRPNRYPTDQRRAMKPSGCA